MSGFLETEAAQMFMSKLAGEFTALFTLNLLGHIEKREYTIDEYVNLFIEQLEHFFRENLSFLLFFYHS